MISEYRDISIANRCLSGARISFAARSDYVYTCTLKHVHTYTRVHTKRVSGVGECAPLPGRYLLFAVTQPLCVFPPVPAVLRPVRAPPVLHSPPTFSLSLSLYAATRNRRALPPLAMAHCVYAHPVIPRGGGRLVARSEGRRDGVGRRRGILLYGRTETARSITVWKCTNNTRAPQNGRRR